MNEEQQVRQRINASNRQYRRLINAQLQYDKELPPEDCDEIGSHKWRLIEEAPDGTQLIKCSRCGKEEII